MTEKKLYEKFSWFRDDVRNSSQVGSKLRIKGRALCATISRNDRKYIEDELLRSARTLAGKPIDVNHAVSQWEALAAAGETSLPKPKHVGHVIDADYEDGFIEYVAEINDNEYVAKLKDREYLSKEDYLSKWDKNPIHGVSVDAVYRYPQNETEKDDITIPIGIQFIRLSLVEDPETPGIQNTTIELMEMEKSLTETTVIGNILQDFAPSLFESYQKEVVSKMSETTSAKDTPNFVVSDDTPVAYDPRREYLMPRGTIPASEYTFGEDPEEEEQEEKSLEEKLGLTEERLGEPHAGYDSYADCVAKNQDKDDPEAYCGEIWKTEKEEKSKEATDLSEAMTEDEIKTKIADVQKQIDDSYPEAEVAVDDGADEQRTKLYAEKEAWQAALNALITKRAMLEIRSIILPKVAPLELKSLVKTPATKEPVDKVVVEVDATQVDDALEKMGKLAKIENPELVEVKTLESKEKLEMSLREAQEKELTELQTKQFRDRNEVEHTEFRTAGAAMSEKINEILEARPKDAEILRESFEKALSEAAEAADKRLGETVAELEAKNILLKEKNDELVDASNAQKVAFESHVEQFNTLVTASEAFKEQNVELVESSNAQKEIIEQYAEKFNEMLAAGDALNERNEELTTASNAQKVAIEAAQAKLVEVETLNVSLEKTGVELAEKVLAHHTAIETLEAKAVETDALKISFDEMKTGFEARIAALEDFKAAYAEEKTGLQAVIDSLTEKVVGFNAKFEEMTKAPPEATPLEEKIEKLTETVENLQTHVKPAFKAPEVLEEDIHEKSTSLEVNPVRG